MYKVLTLFIVISTTDDKGLHVSLLSLLLMYKDYIVSLLSVLLMYKDYIVSLLSFTTDV